MNGGIEHIKQKDGNKLLVVFRNESVYFRV